MSRKIRITVIFLAWSATAMLTTKVAYDVSRRAGARQLSLHMLLPSVLIEERFTSGMTKWQPWGTAAWRSNQVYVVGADINGVNGAAVRIENPHAELIGLKQHVPLVSGEVYRLRAAARSLATNDATRIFGGRVAVYLPPQPEQQLIWMSEYNRWWQKELVFTNQVTGTAVVYVHLGYGNVATTGEFSSIRLERIERTPR